VGPGVRRDDEHFVIPANGDIQRWKSAWVECVGPGVRRDDEHFVIPAQAGIQR